MDQGAMPMKFFQNLSIRNKLVVIVLIVTLSVVGLGFTVMVTMNIKTFENDLINSTKTTADFLADACSTPLSFGSGFESEVTDETDKLIIQATIENAIIYDVAGKKFGQYERVGSPPIETPKLHNEEFIEFKGSYLHLWRPISTKNGRVGTLYMRASRTILNQKINNYLKTMAISLVVLIVLSYVLAVRAQRVISEPILNLARVTGDIKEKGDYSVRVRKTGEDEIGVLYTGFNDMLEQIHLREMQRDEAEAEQRRLMSELADKNKELEQVVYVTSHDLRSPLVNIQGFSKELAYSIEELTTLLQTDEDLAQFKEKAAIILEGDIPDSLKYILSSTAKMDALLAGLLKLSRVGHATVTFATVEMKELISEINNAFEFHLKESGAVLNIGDLPPCFGNDVELNQVFSNLLGNALKYLDRDRPGIISISGQRKGDMVLYCVEDNGIGIAPEHQKKVFEIFHRLNPEETQGEGLGLAIVNKIAARHNGKVWVESEPGKGSQFYVSLPAARAFDPDGNGINGSLLDRQDR
ncbi:MAG: Histidine kinase [Acidobacteriota bacterium]|nr:Histidine kinase [Acidobacteriota bacterium]